MRQQSTLASVKNLLSEGKRMEALELSGQLSGAEMWHETEKAVRENTPLGDCPTCGKRMEVYRVIVDELQAETYCRHCTEEAERIDAEQKKRQVKSRFHARIDEYLKAFGVPKRYMNSTMDQFPAAMSGMVGREKGFFLHGGCGIGKTHLAVALMRAEILAIEPVQEYKHWTIKEEQIPFFISVPDLLLQIRSTFNGNGSEMELVERYSGMEKLILDDLGAEKSTEWVLQTLYTIIDRRNREMLWTTITSNLSIADIARKLDDRIASRIAEMCTIQELQGKDRRLSA